MNLSRSSSVFICSAFVFCFLCGYFAGLQKARIFDSPFDRAYVYDACLTNCITCRRDCGDLLIQKNDNQSVMHEKEDTKEDTDEVKVEEKNKDCDQLFYAQLAGFSYYEKANAYVSKLLSRGIVAFIKTHHYRSAKRKVMREWYQVITKTLPREELDEIVRRIALEDKLQDCVICKYDA